MCFDQNHTRYLRQQDKYSCSAVALLNLDKWRGLKVTKKNLPQYIKLCQAKPFVGTFQKQFDKVVGRRGRRLTYKQFKQHPGATLFETFYPDGHAHDYLVLGWATDGKHFGWLGVNFGGHTYCLIHASHVRWLLKHSRVWQCHR